MTEQSSDAILHVEYTACEVCGDEPNSDAIPPEYVYSLAPEDRDDEEVATYAFDGGLDSPFACSAECFKGFFETHPEVRP